jgi:hypothetical protein
MRFDKIEKFIEKTIERRALPPEVAKLAEPVEDVPASRGGSSKKFVGKKRFNGPKKRSPQG